MGASNSSCVATVRKIVFVLRPVNQDCVKRQSLIQSRTRFERSDSDRKQRTTPCNNDKSTTPVLLVCCFFTPNDIKPHNEKTPDFVRLLYVGSGCVSDNACLQPI